MFKILFLLLLINFSLVSCSTYPGAYTTEESANLLAQNASIKTVVDNLALAEIFATQHSMGMVVGLVTPTSEDYYTYGYKKASSGEPMTKDTIFQIGSVTKVFTSSLLVRLEQEKYLSILDPIKTLFPADFKYVSESLGELTLENLADHSSGLPAENRTFGMFKDVLGFLWDGRNVWKSFEEQMMWDFFGNSDFGKLNNRKYAYTNTAYILLGSLLGRAVPNSDYETLLEQKILTPIHLKDTKFELSPEQKSRLAQGYSGDAPLFMRAGKEIELWEIKKGLRAAGSLYSTAPDLINFLKVNMEMPGSAEKIDFSTARARRIKTPFGHAGLGWFIETLPKSRREYTYANGIIGGYTCFMGFDNNSKVGLVIMQNTMNLNNDIGKNLLDRIVYNYNRKKLELP